MLISFQVISSVVWVHAARSLTSEPGMLGKPHPTSASGLGRDMGMKHDLVATCVPIPTRCGHAESSCNWTEDAGVVSFDDCRCSSVNASQAS